jgi:hypothetical protein
MYHRHKRLDLTAMSVYYFTFRPPPVDQSDGNLWVDAEVLPTPDFDWKRGLSLPNFDYYSKLKEERCDLHLHMSS